MTFIFCSLLELAIVGYKVKDEPLGVKRKHTICKKVSVSFELLIFLFFEKISRKQQDVLVESLKCLKIIFQKKKFGPFELKSSRSFRRERVQKRTHKA